MLCLVMVLLEGTDLPALAQQVLALHFVVGQKEPRNLVGRSHIPPLQLINVSLL